MVSGVCICDSVQTGLLRLILPFHGEDNVVHVAGHRHEFTDKTHTPRQLHLRPLHAQAIHALPSAAHTPTDSSGRGARQCRQSTRLRISSTQNADISGRHVGLAVCRSKLACSTQSLVSVVSLPLPEHLRQLGGTAAPAIDLLSYDPQFERAVVHVCG